MIPKDPVTRLRLGVVGLGRAFSLMLPTLAGDPRIELVAGADPRPEAREKFAADLGAKAFDSMDKLCAEPAVEVVYIATPHQFHAPHAIMAAEHGKHVICEKPMATTLDEANRMVEAVERNGVLYVLARNRLFALQQGATGKPATPRQMEHAGE